jgi:hypothetical protein
MLPVESYPSGVGRELRCWLISGLQEHWVVFVDIDQLSQGFDSEVGERHHSVFATRSASHVR